MHTLAIQENVPLKPFTTFKIGGPARFFAPIAHTEQVQQAREFAGAQRIPIFVLGGGSNLLVSDNGIEALVLHPVSEGVAAPSEEDGSVFIAIEAGEPWDRVVALAVERGWRGIENLSHIPGNAGAAVVQNIGAYGQQLSDVFESAEAADLSTGATRTLRAEECGLGYRRSIFNASHKGRFLISRLKLRLSLTSPPRLDYPDLAAWFGERGIKSPSLAEIRAAIISIRDRKFPFPREEKDGNAGSFFKNVTISPEAYQQLEARVEAGFGPAALKHLREVRNRFPSTHRIPTAFLIELCGLKGFRQGRAGVSETQPLVLLNQGGATAGDVLSLARHIRQTVYQRTGVKVELEPELVGFRPEELAAYMAMETHKDGIG